MIDDVDEDEDDEIIEEKGWIYDGYYVTLEQGEGGL